jgi:hypothetical protein
MRKAPNAKPNPPSKSVNVRRERPRRARPKPHSEAIGLPERQKEPVQKPNVMEIFPRDIAAS